MKPFIRNGGAGALLFLAASITAPSEGGAQERYAPVPLLPSIVPLAVTKSLIPPVAPGTTAPEAAAGKTGMAAGKNGMAIGSWVFAREKTCSISGAVGRPGAFPLRKGERISTLIDRAGGFADNAFLRGAVFSRVSARERNRKALEETISRLEKEAFSAPGDEGAKRGFLERLKKLSPGMRIPVRISHSRLMKGSGDDWILEDGDALAVPAKPGSVTVSGAARTPGPVPVGDPGADPRDLVGKAGGFAEDADREHPYLLKAEGTAVPLWREWIRWNPGETRWEIPRLLEAVPAAEPGDTVVVPRKPASSWSRGIRDLARLLMEIHVLAGERVDPP